MLKTRPSKLNNIGDTIVEVLISIAALGLAFGIAYNIAIRSSTKTENTQIASQATQILQAQIETLRDNAASDSSYFPYGSSNYTCFSPIDTPSTPDTNCTSSLSTGGPAFSVTISPLKDLPSGIIYYSVNVSWASLVDGSTVNQIAYYYP